MLKQTDGVAFIKSLQVASLDYPVAKLDDVALNRLRNPHQTGLEIDSSAVRHGIATHFALEHLAINTYESIRQSAMRCLEDTCVAFTGPFSNLTHCPICNTDGYDPIKLRASGARMHVARQKFVTIPLGAQLH